ncbi:MAG: DUF3737 family protein [Bacilli bacterium]|nr:DUF3737 family protein [Bacilli bacterium]
MKVIKNQSFTGERALFSTQEATIENCVFFDGESPLKESKDLHLSNVTFQWKYPLWYCKNVVLENSTIEETARSGIWYIDNIEVKNTKIIAPKTFRKGKHIKVRNSDFPHGQETLWGCEDINIENSHIVGDYFAYFSNNIHIKNVQIDGNYAFDSCEDILVENCILNSKDSFWNCKNVVIKDTTIIGEYLAWNTKNIRFINCKIESHQGLCYIEDLYMENCTLENSDLTFEFCKNIDVSINSVVDSIKNPISGRIMVKGVKELIMDEKFIEPKNTEIIIK